jgi:hypothetical protein
VAGSAPPSSASVDVYDLNLPEAAIAFGNFARRRAQRVAQLASEVAGGQKRPKRPSELLVEALDGNEADLEELSLRWRLAGVRWPILILMALAFMAGLNAGRRSGSRR